MYRAFSIVLCSLALAGCGGRTADEIIGIVDDQFLANQPFVLTVLVLNPVTCAEVRLDEATCEVDVDEDDRVIKIKAEVPFEEPDDCVPTAGITNGLPVDCSIDPLSAGRWTVEGGGDQPYTTTIDVF